MSRKVNAESISHDRRMLSRKLMQGEISEKDVQALVKNFPTYLTMRKKSLLMKTRNSFLC